MPTWRGASWPARHSSTIASTAPAAPAASRATARSRASIQIRGTGPVRFVTLPAGTLRVKGQSYCASLRGIPFEPCFNLDRSSERSFRGAVAGFNFAYCDFTRGNTAGQARTTLRRELRGRARRCRTRRRPIGCHTTLIVALRRQSTRRNRPINQLVRCRGQCAARKQQTLVEPADTDQHDTETDERQRLVDAGEVVHVDEEHLEARSSTTTAAEAKRTACDCRKMPTASSATPKASQTAE